MLVPLSFVQFYLEGFAILFYMTACTAVADVRIPTSYAPASQAFTLTWSCTVNCLQNSDTMHRCMSNYTLQLNEMDIILSSDHKIDV